MNIDSLPSIGIAAFTLNANHHIKSCLSPFLKSPLRPKILLVDSNSSDGTVETAKKLGVQTVVISQSEFNHGLTREMARRHLNTDIVLMLTPDAYAVDHEVLEKLIAPILRGEASVSYARQIPHEGAGFFESFPRSFNYPDQSHIRTLDDVKTYGVYTFFCSDSCAAYSSKALNEIGGFPAVLLGEDTVAVAKLLRRGHKIAYVAEALVKHSHRYTLLEEFRRYFDTGLARRSYKDLLTCDQQDSHRGRHYVREMFKALIKENPLLIPYAFLHTGVKYFGYRLGDISENSPIWFKKFMSSQKSYWVSNEFLKSKQKDKKALDLKSNDVNNNGL